MKTYHLVEGVMEQLENGKWEVTAEITVREGSPTGRVLSFSRSKCPEQFDTPEQAEAETKPIFESNMKRYQESRPGVRIQRTV